VLCVALALSIREPVDVRVPRTRGPEWAWRTLPLAFRRMLVALALFTLGQASNAFILLRATELGMAATQVALLWAVVSATSTLLAVPLSAWSDRIGRVPLLIVGWSLHALLFVALALVSAPALLWGIAVLLGIYMAATEGAERALIADLVVPDSLGTAYGWYYLTKGLLLLPASAVFGWIWFARDAATAFLTAAALVVSATIVLSLWVLPAVNAHRRDDHRG
jgi:MFS family permease